MGGPVEEPQRAAVAAAGACLSCLNDPNDATALSSPGASSTDVGGASEVPQQSPRPRQDLGLLGGPHGHADHWAKRVFSCKIA